MHKELVYTSDDEIWIPEIDKIVKLRGYKYVAAVVRNDECIGWCPLNMGDQ